MFIKTDNLYIAEPKADIVELVTVNNILDVTDQIEFDARLAIYFDNKVMWDQRCS